MCLLCPTFFLVALLTAGCSPTDDHRSFTTTDSWYAPAPRSISDFTKLATDHFAIVESKLQSEAQTVLSDVSVKQITAEEAVRFAGKTLPTGAVYVLLRGVILNEGTGAFTLSANEDSVCVHHGCLGLRSVPMKRSVVVAVLPKVPEKVYVDCSMAE